MRIVQITDIHIGAEGEPTRDVDARGNFLAILEVAAHLNPDYVVVTGDLCYSTGNAKVYHWIKAQLDKLLLPYDIIPGNHDDTPLLAKAFEREQLLLPSGEMAFVRAIGGFRFLFLDTAAGILSAPQAEWLRAQLTAAQGRQIIFMHHPPLLAGIPFMDNRYALQKRAVFLHAIEPCQYPVQVFCGHYHIEKSVHAGWGQVHITPSTFFQIDQFTEEFAVDHYRPGFRVIELPDSETVRHTVRYLDVAGW